MAPSALFAELLEEEIVYRFPYSRAAVELTTDRVGVSGTADTYGVRLLWHRGKTIRALFESTPLRPIAQVSFGSQTFPLFPSGHSRKGRERIAIAGRRKLGTSPRQALRFHAVVHGRSDRLTWTWRVGATTAALEASSSRETDSLTVALPFAGPVRKVALDGVDHAIAIWTNDLAVTIVVAPGQDTSRTRLRVGAAGLELHCERADFAGSGQTLSWETWLCQARSEADVRDALLSHVADAVERAQLPDPNPIIFLDSLAQTAAARLIADNVVEKRGVDRLVYKTAPGQVGVGDGVDAALTGLALLNRWRLTGDDAHRRRARLIAYGIPAFQIAEEESPHWGALWDRQHDRKTYADARGEETISLVATGRTARGLHLLHEEFPLDLLSRTGVAAAQWLLLKTDRDGIPVGERFLASGPPVVDGSPWVVGEVILPLVETFRVTNNETFLKAALRSIAGIRERLDTSQLTPETASTEHLGSLVEAVLQVSREYESEAMIALANRLMRAIQTRRTPDGGLTDPLGGSALSATIAGIRANLALARVDSGPQWVIGALRGLRAARRLAGDELSCASVADLGALCSLPTQILLTAAARAKNCVADRDRTTITRAWQTFSPDPGTRDYIQVEGDAPVDYLALVCPISLQVLVAVLAPPQVQSVSIVKNHRTPFVRNLLNGDFDLRAELLPLGDGANGRIGVFLADT